MNKYVTHLTKREAQPGMKPGDLVNHNKTMIKKTTPVKISWELETKNELINNLLEQHINKSETHLKDEF